MRRLRRGREEKRTMLEDKERKKIPAGAGVFWLWREDAVELSRLVVALDQRLTFREPKNDAFALAVVTVRGTFGDHVIEDDDPGSAVVIIDEHDNPVGIEIWYPDARTQGYPRFVHIF